MFEEQEPKDFSPDLLQTYEKSLDLARSQADLIPEESRSEVIAQLIAEKVAYRTLAKQIGHPFYVLKKPTRIMKVILFPVIVFIAALQIHQHFARFLLSFFIPAAMASMGWLGSSPVEVAILSLVVFSLCLYVSAVEQAKQEADE
jgi:hypothetical protein